MSCCVRPYFFPLREGQSVLTHHVRPDVASGQAVFLNRLAANQSLRLNIALPLWNEAELDALLQLYDPQSEFLCGS